MQRCNSRGESFSSWWFQPISKILVKLEHKKNLKPLIGVMIPFITSRGPPCSENLFLVWEKVQGKPPHVTKGIDLLSISKIHDSSFLYVFLKQVLSEIAGGFLRILEKPSPQKKSTLKFAFSDRKGRSNLHQGVPFFSLSVEVYTTSRGSKSEGNFEDIIMGILATPPKATPPRNKALLRVY